MIYIWDIMARWALGKGSHGTSQDFQQGEEFEATIFTFPFFSDCQNLALLSITEPLSLNEVLLNEEGDFPTSFVKINFFPLYINLRSFQICNNKEKGERKMATLLLSCCLLVENAFGCLSSILLPVFEARFLKPVVFTG